MKNNLEQQFLKDLDKNLWKSADKLRSSIDAANYKHIVLGLIFLKYISDAFEKRRQELREEFKNEESIYYLGEFADDEAFVNEELENQDYYLEKNVFWVPLHARWEYIQNTSALPIGTALWSYTRNERVEIEGKLVSQEKMIDVKLRSISWLIDNAFDELEKANTKLKNILNTVSQYELSNDKFAGLITTFSTTSFTNPEFEGQKINLTSKDTLGHVYEYFLGEFALAEGKQGGQYYTPKSIVRLIVEMLEPYKGRVYDPAMGSGGFFISSKRFIESKANIKHYDAKRQKQQISLYGQESNPTTWRLATMNLAIRGMDFDFGRKNADSFLDDQHKSLKADYIMANPPFNMSDWWHESLEGDIRWKYGTPPRGNANFGWMQHMIHHLAPNGSMALLLANGSMSSMTNSEGSIRRAILKADLVECIVALPGQLFTNTQIPACIWFLTRNKTGDREVNLRTKSANRQGRLLFIDARKMGHMKNRVLRDFTLEDLNIITDKFHAWQQQENYENIAGFCYEADLEEIAKNDYILTPGRYVGVPEIEEDSEPFDEKMIRLTAHLRDQFTECSELEKEIRQNLRGLGYDI